MIIHISPKFCTVPSPPPYVSRSRSHTYHFHVKILCQSFQDLIIFLFDWQVRVQVRYPVWWQVLLLKLLWICMFLSQTFTPHACYSPIYWSISSYCSNRRSHILQIPHFNCPVITSTYNLLMSSKHCWCHLSIIYRQYHKKSYFYNMRIAKDPWSSV